MKKNAANVLILMATYNGERFLKDQIDSIINQTFTKWHLLIQDDGSNDSTNKILEDYVGSDSRITCISNNSKYHGPYYNFHTLINYAKDLSRYDYYVFADQDDIWESNKLEILLREFKEIDDAPSLVYSDMKIIDEKNNITGDSIVNILGLRIINPMSTFFSHQIFGCATAINEKLFMLVPKVDVERKQTAILSHDNYYAKFAAAYGKIKYCPQKLVRYRRYSGNVTANYQYNFKLSRILNRFVNIDSLAKDHARTYSQTLETIKYMKKIEYVSPLFSFYDIESSLLNGGIRATAFILKNKISWGKLIKSISHIIVVLSNKYKKYLII